jgi:hypothetical protein
LRVWRACGVQGEREEVSSLLASARKRLEKKDVGSLAALMAVNAVYGATDISVRRYDCVCTAAHCHHHILSRA